MVSIFNRLIQPYARRIRLMVSRGVIRRVNDQSKIQTVQVALLADEIRDLVERFQQYGLTSVPFEGAEGIFLSIGGSRDHGITIAVDDRRYRLKGLKDGEVALYDDQGQVVHLKREKKLHVYGSDEVTIEASVKVILDTPEFHCTGNITAAGDISDKTRSMAADRDIYDQHGHDKSGLPTVKQ